MKQHDRHLLLQKIFWNPLGAWLIGKYVRFESLFNVVVRNYSLIGHSNGERWILSLLKENSTVFDVGFHDGASCEEILNICPTARIKAFDPSTFARKKFEEKFSEDNRIELMGVALSSKPSTAKFHDYDNMCNSLAIRKDVVMDLKASYDVVVDTIDNVCKSQGVEMVDFMKIDVEGFDLDVLEGSRDMLKEQKIALFIFEFASGWAANRRYLWEVDEFFKDKPYSLYRLFNGFLSPFVYHHTKDSCMTLSTMYVGISDKFLMENSIPVRNYNF
jgi:FkbM family methyltransferase